ncbi:MAG TPA: thioredoxin family protein [Steroidobacteraceae bacterium]|jgi:predicted dithiol-disulfide oxidoreductase (DUF899 family)
MERHQIASREDWLEARAALLAKEKEITHLRDAATAQRLALPWIKVDKNYVFDGPNRKMTLSDLFQGRSQLYIKHFMMAPGAQHQCVGCSLEVDHVEGILVHLENHDVSYAVVARAPIEEIETVRRRMGWRFLWVSSYHNDFNYDFNVSFTGEEMAARRAFYNFRWTDPGLQDLSGRSIFYKDEEGQIFHTYSAYGRGGEDVLGIYGMLDAMPKGRNETGPYHSMGDWVRPHDMYGKEGTVEGNGRFHASACGCEEHK